MSRQHTVALVRGLQSDVDERAAYKLLTELRTLDPSFKDFTSSDYKLLAKVFSFLQVNKNDKLIVRGEASSFFGVLLKGSLTSIMEDKTHHAIKRGEFFGEGGYFEHSARIADVVATSTATVAVLAYDDMHQLNASLPDLYVKLNGVLGVASIRRLKRPPPMMGSSSSASTAPSASASTTSLLPPSSGGTQPHSPLSPSQSATDLTDEASPSNKDTSLPAVAETTSESTAPSSSDDTTTTNETATEVANESNGTQSSAPAATTTPSSPPVATPSTRGIARLHERRRSASAATTSPQHRTTTSNDGHTSLPSTSETTPSAAHHDDTASNASHGGGRPSLARSPSRAHPPPITIPANTSSSSTSSSGRAETLFRSRKKRPPLAATIVAGATARTRTTQMSMDASSHGGSLFFAALAEQVAHNNGGGPGHGDGPSVAATPSNLVAATPSSVRSGRLGSSSGSGSGANAFEPGSGSGITAPTPTSARGSGGSLNNGIRREPSSASASSSSASGSVDGKAAPQAPLTQHERSNLQHLVNNLKTKLANAEEVSEERKNEASRLKIELDRVTAQLAAEKRAHANSQAETAGLFDMLRDERNAKTGLQSDVMDLRVTMTLKEQSALSAFDRELQKKDSDREKLREELKAKLDQHTEITNEKEELVRRLQDSLSTEQKQRRKAEQRGDEQSQLYRATATKLNETEEYVRKLKNDIIGYERRVALLEAYKVKSEEDAEMAEHETRKLVKREQQRRGAIRSLRKDLGCYQTLLKYIAVHSFVKGLQLRKRLREVQAKAQSITQQAQREQETSQPPGQETFISEKELYEAKLTDANGVTKAPTALAIGRGTQTVVVTRRERRSVPVMTVVKQLDEEMVAIMTAVNDVKAQKAHWHDTADSFFERTIELTQEASLHTGKLVDAEREVTSLRDVVKQTSAELRVTQGQLAAAQVHILTREDEQRANVEQEQRALRSKQLERSSLFERSVQLRRRVTQLEHYLVELADRKDRLEQNMVRTQQQADKQLSKWQSQQESWAHYQEWVAWHRQQQALMASQQHQLHQPGQQLAETPEIEVEVEPMSQFEEVFTPRGREPMSPSATADTNGGSETSSPPVEPIDADIYAPLSPESTATTTRSIANPTDGSPSSNRLHTVGGVSSTQSSNRRLRMTARGTARGSKSVAATRTSLNNTTTADTISESGTVTNDGTASASPTATRSVRSDSSNPEQPQGAISVNSNGSSSSNATWRQMVHGRGARASAARSAAVYGDSYNGKRIGASTIRTGRPSPPTKYQPVLASTIPRGAQGQGQSANNHEPAPLLPLFDDEGRAYVNTHGHNSSGGGVTFEEKENSITFTPRPPQQSYNSDEKTPQRVALFPTVDHRGNIRELPKPNNGSQSARVTTVDQRWHSIGGANGYQQPAVIQQAAMTPRTAEMASFVSLPPVEPLHRMVVPVQQ